MKIFDIVYKEGETEGIYALGMVYDPAMQDNFVALSQEEIKLSIDEEKRMVFGAVLIPNKEILRVDGEGNSFALRFSEDTIEQLGHDWIAKGSHVNFSEQHEKKIEGLAAVEMWTVKDPNNDTSNFYGKTYPKGTLVALSKVNNDDTWSKIKSGEINGYSIEAILGLEEINLKQQLTMTDEVKKSFLTELKEDIKALFTAQKEEVNEPEQEATLEATEVNEVEEVEAQPEFDVEAFKKEMSEALGVEFSSQLENVKTELNNELAKKDETIKELEAKLAKQPEAEEIVESPTEKVELKQVQYGQNRPKTIQDRVFAYLNNN